MSVFLLKAQYFTDFFIHTTWQILLLSLIGKYLFEILSHIKLNIVLSSIFTHGASVSFFLKVDMESLLSH